MRFYDKVGFAITREVDPVNKPGIYTDVIEEGWYVGDFLYNITSKWVSSTQANDDLRINNKISIVADAFAEQNFNAIKYIRYNGVKWKVVSVEIARPRLILTTGGEYHDQQGT